MLAAGKTNVGIQYYFFETPAHPPQMPVLLQEASAVGKGVEFTI